MTKALFRHHMKQRLAEGYVVRVLAEAALGQAPEEVRAAASASVRKLAAKEPFVAQDGSVFRYHVARLRPDDANRTVWLFVLYDSMLWLAATVPLTEVEPGVTR
jgi:hypothetical protein